MQSLSPLIEFHGHYINNDKIFTQIASNSKNKNLIALDINQTVLPYATELNLECYTGNDCDFEGLINYQDLVSGKHRIASFGSTINIFNPFGFGKNIKDIFNFDIHISDSFIAKILISIILYKRNNNIVRLTEKDYNHIFEFLFNEKVDIIKEAEKDIQKKLIYVPQK